MRACFPHKSAVLKINVLRTLCIRNWIRYKRNFFSSAEETPAAQEQNCELPGHFFEQENFHLFTSKKTSIFSRELWFPCFQTDSEPAKQWKEKIMSNTW
jgi:hypothetical protein